MLNCHPSLLCWFGWAQTRSTVLYPICRRTCAMNLALSCIRASYISALALLVKHIIFRIDLRMVVWALFFISRRKCTGKSGINCSSCFTAPLRYAVITESNKVAFVLIFVAYFAILHFKLWQKDGWAEFKW